MPNSRSRRSLNRSDRDRHAQRRRRARDAQRRATPMMPPPAARDDLMARYDEDAWRTVDAGAAAEAQGDAEGALQLHLAGPHVPGSLRKHMLSEVALLADDAPAWLHARWVAKQAYRWLLLSDDARPREALQMTVD